jgi:hypothetical protein
MGGLLHISHQVVDQLLVGCADLVLAALLHPANVLEDRLFVWLGMLRWLAKLWVSNDNPYSRCFAAPPDMA